jgi:cysteine dioxygenase
LNCHDLDELCRRLELDFERDTRGKGVAHLLSEYCRSARDWCEFQLFSEETYTRNLIHRCGEFELLLLCWNPGQESPIHDHAGQDCWMAVLEGELEEVHYQALAGGEGRPLEEGKRTAFNTGGVAFIQDGIALHKIRPLRGARGISLHLYSNPIDTCRVYDPASGRARSVDLGYQSVRGRPCDKSPAAIRAEWAARLA